MLAIFSTFLALSLPTIGIIIAKIRQIEKSTNVNAHKIYIEFMQNAFLLLALWLATFILVFIKGAASEIRWHFGSIDIVCNCLSIWFHFVLFLILVDTFKVYLTVERI